MNKKILILILLLCQASFLCPKASFDLSVTRQEAKKIGMQIQLNEGGQKIENLIVWRENEPCLSLGIYHFIWYPENSTKPHAYKETFPQLVTFMKKNKKPLPRGITLNEKNHCPWPNRQAFLNDIKSTRKTLLAAYLSETIDLQTEFIIQRFKKSVPHIVESISNKKKRTEIEMIIKKLLKTTTGKYVLIDYLNFKGEGTNPSENYGSVRWGLLQVLEGMNPQASDILAEFAKSAVTTLEKRVTQAPKEIRWLPGWKNRIKTYTEFR